eukprot:403336153
MSLNWQCMKLLFQNYDANSQNQFNAKVCLDPGLNQGPSDLQSDALPTELPRLSTYLAFIFSFKSLQSPGHRITLMFMRKFL